jgi:hypothetical protein
MAREVVLTLFQGITVFTAVAALLFTAKSLDLTAKAIHETAKAPRDQQVLSEKGQFSDRFGKAVDQLGQEAEDKLSIRLGGIYGLEHVMRDSHDDRPAVVEVLCAFVRTHGDPPAGPDRSANAGLTPVAQDVQAAVVVLGRRIDRAPPSDQGLDLSGAYLRDANLSRANLASAGFGGDAVLAGANLTGANLSSTHLGGVDLVSAKLTDAILTGADLTDANLTDAELAGVDLSKTVGLETAQLADAHLDAKTRIPDEVARPLPTPTR